MKLFPCLANRDLELIGCYASPQCQPHSLDLFVEKGFVFSTVLKIKRPVFLPRVELVHFVINVCFEFQTIVDDALMRVSAATALVIHLAFAAAAAAAMMLMMMMMMRFFVMNHRADGMTMMMG